jgi:hypothetical protein
MERKLAPILCANVHAYSRLMGSNEDATVGTLNSYRNIIDSLIARCRGRFVGSAGESVLAEFGSVIEAVQPTASPMQHFQPFRRPMRLDPAMGDYFAVELGFAYLDLGRFQEATAVFTRYKTSFPADGRFLLRYRTVDSVHGTWPRPGRPSRGGVMRLSLQFTLPSPGVVNKDIARGKRYEEDMRKAGIEVNAYQNEHCARQE